MSPPKVPSTVPGAESARTNRQGHPSQREPCTPTPTAGMLTLPRVLHLLHRARTRRPAPSLSLNTIDELWESPELWRLGSRDLILLSGFCAARWAGTRVRLPGPTAYVRHAAALGGRSLHAGVEVVGAQRLYCVKSIRAPYISEQEPMQLSFRVRVTPTLAQRGQHTAAVAIHAVEARRARRGRLAASRVAPAGLRDTAAN